MMSATHKTYFDWLANRAPYPTKNAWFSEQSLWAIAACRYGRWNDQQITGLSRWFLDRFCWLAFRIVETGTSISFNKAVEIGPALPAYHFGNIFVQPGVVMGAACTLRLGVTHGTCVVTGPQPRKGNRVNSGAYARLPGPFNIDDRARIGAMRVVSQDVTPDHKAVGTLARIIAPADDSCCRHRAGEQPYLGGAV